MEQTGHRRYEKKKRRNTLQLRPVKLLITQHKDIRMLKKTRQSSHYKMTKKTVYMFSNIFVLYYIQLSLLKNGIQMIIILQDRGDKKANCSVSPAGL